LTYFSYSVFVQPSSAQFGVAAGRKKVGTSFHELNERLKSESDTAASGTAGVGDLSNIQELMAKAFEDPATLQAIQQMTSGFQDAMQELSKMDPSALQSQMEQVLNMMTQGDIMDAVLSKKDDVLANLELTGLVPPEELAKYKADPAYFETQMKGAFDQMKGIFSDPTVLETASKAMQGMQAAMTDPLLLKLNELLLATREVTALEMEELRLLFLQAPDHPALTMFQGLAEEIKDSRKFQKGFQEARQSIKDLMDDGASGFADIWKTMMDGMAAPTTKGTNIMGGAGVGEL
jgi:hypothetical protein